MAIILIKEDGSGLSDSNVYADLDDLDVFAELLGEDLSAYSDEQKKSAMYVAANKYIDRLHEFKGVKVSESQSMKLYTDEVTFADASADIIQANVEAAILQLKSYLFVDAASQNSNGDIIEESSGLSSLTETIKYSEGTRKSTKYNTSTIDALLSKYTVYGSGGVALVRM